MAKNCYCDWNLVWWWFWIFGSGSDYVLSKILGSGSDSDTIEIFQSGSDYQISISAQHWCRSRQIFGGVKDFWSNFRRIAWKNLDHFLCEYFLMKTGFLLTSKNEKAFMWTMVGLGLGGPEARLKRGALWWRHHTQTTVIITFDLPKIRPPKGMFLRLRHNWNSRRRKCKRVFMIHNLENTESWENKAGNT